MKENKSISEILKNTPLNIRFNVANEMKFIDLITELGYRKDKMWTDDENELLNKLCDLAKKHTESLLIEIEKWKEDGCP